VSVEETRLTAVEIKTGTTLVNDQVAILRRLTEPATALKPVPKVEPVRGYGGADAQRRNGTRVPPLKAHRRT